MGKLRIQVVGADTVGSTYGSRETIGTVTLPSDCEELLGFLVQRGSTATTTTAEATQGRVFAQSALFYDMLELTCGQPTGSGAATNEAGVWDPGIFYPVRKRDSKMKVANEKITFYYDTQIEMTQEDYVQVFVFSTEGGIDKTVMSQRGDPLTAINKIVDWSGICFDGAINAAVSEAINTQTVTVPAGVEVIHGVVVTVANDAVNTAGEHLAAYVTLGGSFPAMENINVPLPLQAGSLGTSIDWQPNMRSYVYPLYIPVPVVGGNITCTANLAATTSGANLISLDFLGTRRTS